VTALEIVVYPTLSAAAANSGGRRFSKVASAMLSERINGELSFRFSVRISANDGRLTYTGGAFPFGTIENNGNMYNRAFTANGVEPLITGKPLSPTHRTGLYSDHDNSASTSTHEIITQNGLKVNISNYIRFQNQIYAITQIHREIGDELYFAQIECEHCSNALNDAQYNIPAFIFNGTPTQGLTQLLSGTPLSVGIVEPTGNFNIQYTEGELTRRAALMNFISDVGGEIEYSGNSVNIRNHRGSITPVELMNGQHATNLAKTELRGKATAYEIPLFRLGSLKLGDEVHIKYTPLDIDVNTRIIGLEYNPFYEIGTVRIEVGAYIPEQLSTIN
jgi:hypothetical protein